MTLLGLHGYARSGKDSIANYLVEKHGFTRVALADAVRDAVYALNPLIPWEFNADVPMRLAHVVDVWGWEKVKATDEGRRLLQAMGTEVGRAMFGENVWLDIAAKKIDAVSGPVVVTDIRFENELKWLKNWHSTSVKVTREGFGPVNSHSSDAGIHDMHFDKHIKNNGTLEDLYASVEAELKLKLDV